MAKEYATTFYHSTAWRKTRDAFFRSKFGICELCAAPADIVHHRKHITPENINDPSVTLNFDNLMCLCRECHNRIHEQGEGSVRAGLLFDEHGQLIKVAGPPKKFFKN